MARASEPIARIRLARSLPRLLAWPVALVAAGVGLGVAGLLVGDGIGIGLAVAGGLVAVIGAAWAARLLSVRLDVDEAEVRVHWLGGERRYALSPGPVTRVRFRGENASRLRVQRGFLGYGLGPARLRDEERIHVVRLAPTATAILIPTDEGRLAIAAAEEPALLDALSRAARARQRLDEVARTAAPPGAMEVDEPAEPAPEAPGPGQAEPGPPPEAAPLEAEARLMTGIERMLYEQRLADDRARAEAAAAEAAAAEAEAARRMASTADVGAVDASPATDRMIAPAADAPSAEDAVRATTRRSRPSVSLGRPAAGLIRRHARAAVALVPLLGAIAAWGLGMTVGEMLDPSSDLGRLTALALVMAGPAASIGTLLAGARWPQLTGLVVMSGLAASVLIGRVLLGG